MLLKSWSILTTHSKLINKMHTRLREYIIRYDEAMYIEQVWLYRTLNQVFQQTVGKTGTRQINPNLSVR